MNSDWALVFRGFSVAGIGASSTICYIIGISAAYVGRFMSAFVVMAIGAMLAFSFFQLIGKYLDAIDQREATESAQMEPQIGAAGAFESAATEKS